MSTLQRIFCGLVLTLLVSGCKRPETVVPAAAESAGLTSSDGTGDPLAPLAALEAAHHSHDEPETEVLTAPQAVEQAVYSARFALASELTRRASQAAQPASQPPGKVVRIIFGSNINGELEDCGCHRNPLGGLARRSTMVNRDGRSNDLAAVFQLDAGNALFKAVRVLGDQESRERIAARAILDAYRLIGVSAIAVGAQDLAGGGKFLLDAASSASLPLVTANVGLGGKPLGSPSVVLTDNGFKLGVTGVTSPTAPVPDFFAQVGVQIEDPATTVAPVILALRQQGVDLVVLFVTGGFESVESMMPTLGQLNALPDVVLVSGSNRMSQEPTWIQGVPAIEAGNRGKHLMFADFTLVDGAATFQPPQQDTVAALAAWMTALRSVNSTLANQRRAAADPAASSRLRSYERLLVTQTRELNAAMRRVSTMRLPSAEEAAKPRSSIRLNLAPVAIETVEESRVKERVDAAKAEMGPDPAAKPEEHQKPE